MPKQIINITFTYLNKMFFITKWCDAFHWIQRFQWKKKRRKINYVPHIDYDTDSIMKRSEWYLDMELPVWSNIVMGFFRDRKWFKEKTNWRHKFLTCFNSLKVLLTIIFNWRQLFDYFWVTKRSTTNWSFEVWLKITFNP